MNAPTIHGSRGVQLGTTATILVVLVFASLSASAQQSAKVLEEQEGAAPESQDAGPEISIAESVTVTAGEREQSLLELPVSLTLMPGERIFGLEIGSLVDLAEFVPNLLIEDGSQGAAIVMRGIGNNGGTNYGFDSPVGTFLDGVYYGRNNHAWLPFLDVERVEILRGPQSTVFGMNTVAGAISVVSGQPTDRLEAGLRMSHDPTYGRTAVTGVVSGPLSDTLAGRLAATKRGEGGYFHSTFLDRDVYGVDDEAARATLRWRPASRLTVTAKLERSTRFQDGSSRQLISPTTDANALARQLAADPDATFLPDLETPAGEEFRDLRSDAAVITANYAFDGFSLTSISAYTSFNGRYQGDLDASGLSLGAIRAHEDFAQFSQELRITSRSGGPIEYVAGAYYQDSELVHDRLLDFALAEFVPAFAGTPAGELQTYAGNFAQDHRTVSLFGRVGWEVSEDLWLIGGVRYSEETKNAASFFDWLVPGTMNPTDVLEPGSDAFSAANFVFHDLFGIERHTDRGTYARDRLLPEIKLKWNAGQDLMLYAGRTEGHKSGGFNDRDNKAVNFSFGPESSVNYEIGVRATLAAGAAYVGATLFHMGFEDMQVSVFDLDNLVFIVDNAAKATTRGVEMTWNWRASDELWLDGSLGWLQAARFDEFLVPCVAGPDDADCIPGAEGDVRDEGGEDLNTPRVFLGVGAAYGTALTPSWRLDGRLDVNYRGASEDVVNRDGGIEAVSFVNSRVVLTWRDRWSIAVVGRNLTDERFVATRQAQLFAGSEQGEIRPPRTITLQFGYVF